ncbi:hypothetical protein HPP92_014299 [Vanilla planifolia]|uniref:Uncharacterized protein n=1 Tax=Vanilla planifolia TaxID=51239 RepID=A0A835UXI2_VANPL|nr:hypothetical protein HPP92_014299 [Vanilla planifolia]
MLQFVSRRATVTSILQTKKIRLEMAIGVGAQSIGLAASQVRLYGMVGAIESPSEKIARQMIQYALGSARSQKSEDSYAQAMMVLEQGISNFQGVDSSKDAVGMLMLAVSTLIYEREELKDAMDKLQIVRRLDHASLAIKVAACEALVGLNLESGQFGRQCAYIGGS